jgi:hypothetical protein
MSSARGLRNAFLVLLALAVAAVAAVAVIAGARSAALTLAGVLAAAALARSLAPETVVPAARSRVVDVALLAGLAAALVYLAPWGDATLSLP